MNHDFDGPLDLLLDEVRRQNVAIEHIAMAPIVSRYLEYMRAAAGRNWRLDIEWLYMAATLIQWKSRALLAHQPADSPDADPVREELVQQLLTHRREIAGDLARRWTPEAGRPERTSADESPEQAGPGDSAFVTVWDLMEQARDIARWAGQQARDRARMLETLGIEADETDIAEMTALLETELGGAGQGLDFTRLLMQQASPARRSFLFLSGLGLVHSQRAQVVQKEAFGTILLSLASAPGDNRRPDDGDIQRP